MIWFNIFPVNNDDTIPIQLWIIPHTKSNKYKKKTATFKLISDEFNAMLNKQSRLEQMLKTKQINKFYLKKKKLI